MLGRVVDPELKDPLDLQVMVALDPPVHRALRATKELRVIRV
jgi:hypothetical protein